MRFETTVTNDYTTTDTTTTTTDSATVISDHHWIDGIALVSMCQSRGAVVTRHMIQCITLYDVYPSV